LNGILLVDKPEELSSAAVVRLVKKTYGVEKIGHLGTLDPFASGLLPLCMGTGTKIAQFLIAERKAYSGTIRLGVETDTMDRTGTVTRTASLPHYQGETLNSLAKRFLGEYWQTPPMYSALKRNGTPLYKLARRGIVVEREPRKVCIEHLSLVQLEPDLLGFSLTCSKGAYVRVLAADIGTALGCGAHLVTLRRTAFGGFVVDDALSLQQLLEKQVEIPAVLLSPAQAMRHYQTVSISSEMVTRLRQGQQEMLSRLLSTTHEQAIAALLDPDGALVAVVENQQSRWRLARVL
jgi:tRNA pseudouridine55 synthase